MLAKLCTVVPLLSLFAPLVSAEWRTAGLTLELGQDLTITFMGTLLALRSDAPNHISQTYATSPGPVLYALAALGEKRSGFTQVMHGMRYTAVLEGDTWSGNCTVRAEQSGVFHPTDITRFLINPQALHIGGPYQQNANGCNLLCDTKGTPSAVDREWKV